MSQRLFKREDCDTIVKEAASTQLEHILWASDCESVFSIGKPEQLDEREANEQTPSAWAPIEWREFRTSE